MKEVCYYESFDGIRFDNEYDCIEYEWVELHREILDKIDFYSDNKTKIRWSLLDKFYSDVNKIVVYNQEQVQAIQDLNEYAGFCAFETINSIGTWIYDEESTNFIKE